MELLLIGFSAVVLLCLGTLIGGKLAMREEMCSRKDSCTRSKAHAVHH
jgi:hypothetical protein